MVAKFRIGRCCTKVVVTPELVTVGCVPTIDIVPADGVIATGVTGDDNVKMPEATGEKVIVLPGVNANCVVVIVAKQSNCPAEFLITAARMLTIGPPVAVCSSGCMPKV